MLLHKTEILYIGLYLSSVYGWIYPINVVNGYVNEIQQSSSYINDNLNCQYPSNDFRCKYQALQPYNLDENSDDNHYSKEHKKTIPDLLQEIKSHIINLSASRYQPFFPLWPVWFYPQTNVGVDLPKPTNEPEIFHRYPSEDDTNLNWGLDPNTDYDPSQIWGTHTKEDNKNSTKNECSCEKANDKATAPTFQQKYSVDSSIRCRAAALYCCISGNTKKQQEYCFESQGCLDSYKTGYACLPVVIRAVYAELYKDIL